MRHAFPLVHVVLCQLSPPHLTKLDSTNACICETIMGRKLILDYDYLKSFNVNEGDLKSCDYNLKNILLPCQCVAWAKPCEYESI